MLVLGLAVREAFSFWTGHPFDFEIWVRAGYWVWRGFSPYAPMPSAPGLTFANPFGNLLHAAVGYLPFWPLLLAGIYGLYTVVGFGDRFVYYFLIKQPIIIGDVLVAYLLYRYVSERNPELAPKVMALWLFSPFTIIISSIWGTFDSLAILFVMLALLARAGRTRAAWDGFATFVKSIPLLFILPLSYSQDKRVANFLVALGLPSILALLVVFLAGWPVAGQTFTVSTTLANTLRVSSWPLSLWGTLLFLNAEHVVSNAVAYNIISYGGYVWVAGFVISSLLARRWFGFGTERGVIQSMLVIVLTFLLVRGQVNEQYTLYLFALLLIDVALWSPQRMRLFYALTLVMLVETVTNNLLLIRFVSPVYANASGLEASLIASTGQLRNVLLWLEGLVLCGLNIWYLASLIRERGYAAEWGSRREEATSLLLLLLVVGVLLLLSIVGLFD
jgi:hypothetical protein